MHRQFFHTSKEKLCKLLKHSPGFDNDEFLDIVKEQCDLCEVCQKFKHPPSRSVVGLPLADNFNQVVCMDLKEYIHNEVWILHLIDAATRYSAACLIRTRNPDKIIRCVYLIWIAYFGSPGKFLSDNGGEFSDETYGEMNEKLNVITFDNSWGSSIQQWNS